jgi:hypothetical protein
MSAQTEESATPQRASRSLRRPRRWARRTALWGGLAVFALVIAGYPTNLFYGAGGITYSKAHRYTGFLAEGAVWMIRSPIAPMAGSPRTHEMECFKSNARSASDFSWWFSAQSGSSSFFFVLPYWAFAVPALAGSLWGWRRLRRLRNSGKTCMKCGYDRAGLPAGAPCPECGQ